MSLFLENFKKRASQEEKPVTSKNVLIEIQVRVTLGFLLMISYFLNNPGTVEISTIIIVNLTI
jgi:hypothetical protein